MIELRNKETTAHIGNISEEDLSFLIDMLEEEGVDDQDYWIDIATLDYFEENGCGPHLLEMLQDAVGESDGIEIEWVTE